MKYLDNKIDKLLLTKQTAKKMEMYAASVGAKQFDWNAFLHKNIYTQEELDEAYELASNWPTCAVGNTCSIIPRNKTGSPKDIELLALGTNFFTHVSKMQNNDSSIYDHQQEAKAIWVDIEWRAIELVNEIVRSGGGATL